MDSELRILVCGKTGVGKSTLVNTIIGTEVVETGGPGSEKRNTDEESKGFDPLTVGNANGDSCPSTHTLAPVTKIIKTATAQIGETKVTVYDSPGLQDATNMDEDYLTKIDRIWKSGSGVDLILYCIEYTMSTWFEPDKMAIRLLTERYGASFWSKSILVLTKANQFQFSKPSVLANAIKRSEWTKACEAQFLELKMQFKQQLYDLLSEVEHDCIENIPVIAGGVSECDPSDRMLLFVAPGKTDKDYLSTIWLECVKRLPENSRLAFINATDPSTITLASEIQSNQSKRYIYMDYFEINEIVSLLNQLVVHLQVPHLVQHAKRFLNIFEKFKSASKEQ